MSYSHKVENLIRGEGAGVALIRVRVFENLLKKKISGGCLLGTREYLGIPIAGEVEENVILKNLLKRNKFSFNGRSLNLHIPEKKEITSFNS